MHEYKGNYQCTQLIIHFNLFRMISIALIITLASVIIRALGEMKSFQITINEVFSLAASLPLAYMSTSVNMLYNTHCTNPILTPIDIWPDRTFSRETAGSNSYGTAMITF